MDNVHPCDAITAGDVSALLHHSQGLRGLHESHKDADEESQWRQSGSSAEVSEQGSAQPWTAHRLCTALRASDSLLFRDSVTDDVPR